MQSEKVENWTFYWSEHHAFDRW